MRAINLIPPDARRAGSAGAPSTRLPAGYAVLVVLAAAVALVTVYVLTTNTISARKAKLQTVQAQVTQAQALAARLDKYAQFVKLAQQRAETVRQIAASRFDWHAALEDLSRVVPANTSVQSLVGTVAPGATASGGGGGGGGSAPSTGSLRTDIASPAFEMRGCTATQDDVARLMSRLRLIDGVTRVTLADSAKQDEAQSGASVTTGTGGCGSQAPSFDLVVFFKPLPGAGPNGVTSVSSQPVSTAASTAGAAK